MINSFSFRTINENPTIQLELISVLSWYTFKGNSSLIPIQVITRRDIASLNLTFRYVGPSEAGINSI